MSEAISRRLVAVLDEHKAADIALLDVRKLTTITDTLIIASGRSDRQVKALADKVITAAKKMKLAPLGVEGLAQGEWVLIDLGDIVVHIMQPTTRLYYQLERLWSGEIQQASGQ